MEMGILFTFLSCIYPNTVLRIEALCTGKNKIFSTNAFSKFISFSAERDLEATEGTGNVTGSQNGTEKIEFLSKINQTVLTGQEHFALVSLL